MVAIGFLICVYAGLWKLGLAPGSQVSVPRPVAVDPTPRPPLPTAPPIAPTIEPATPLPTEGPTPITAFATAAPTPVAEPLRPADADDRAHWLSQQSGYAVRLSIPSIRLDTVVQQAGIVQDSHRDWVWQTLPFVAVHYGGLTSMIGAPGNAVIAGHVVTLDEGNVFRNLYRVQIDDPIQVWDDAGREHNYHTVDVQLVSPSDTSVMEPTRDETLTLITCGGTFDPIKRDFSARLIVTAKPLKQSGQVG